jgi:hypothetical protein
VTFGHGHTPSAGGIPRHISTGNFARLAVAAGVVRLSASFTPTLSDVTLAFSGPCQPELLRFHLIRHHLAADAHRLLFAAFCCG